MPEAAASRKRQMQRRALERFFPVRGGLISRFRRSQLPPHGSAQSQAAEFKLGLKIADFCVFSRRKGSGLQTSGTLI